MKVPIFLGQGRVYVQVLASLAANLGQHARGQSVTMSTYMLPQLQPEDQSPEDFILNEDQGSWFGRELKIETIYKIMLSLFKWR